MSANTNLPILPQGFELPSANPLDAPMPRPARARRRDKSDRGLPPDAEIARLATKYLLVQSKLWPAVVKADALPAMSDAAIAEMVADFKQRHRTGIVDAERLRGFYKLCGRLAGGYNRYSCDNSSPTSIIDQMVKSLEKARQEDRFIPWEYVFCDYSVSGLIASRQGYMSYKGVLSDPRQMIDTTYVDDFSRASRDEIEWWRLAWLSKRLKKRMIGASDGFDLSGPNGEIMVTMFGLLSRLFIKSLREKVNRGMRGAARRRTCLGKQSLGFTRCVVRDEAGVIVKGPDDRPIFRPCIDPVTQEYRKLLYDLFVDKKWSVYQIAKHFNRLKIDGWDGWTEAGIKKLLWSATAIGVFTWNRNRREYDREQEKWVLLRNPRSEWEVYHDPKLAIVPVPTWAAARKRLLAMRTNSPLTGRKPSRNQVSATTLFSGTLICGYCGRELLLCRSTAKYKVMGCLNGRIGGHGCQLSTSKSTTIIEKSLLTFLRNRIVTKEAIEKLVVQANAYLAAEAAKPRSNTAPLKSAIREKETEIGRQFKRMEAAKDEALVQAYEKNIADLQKEVNELKRQLREVDVENVKLPDPLDATKVVAKLGDIQALLQQEIPAAAEVIRKLTGPIRITQQRALGQTRGATWVATFSPNLVELLRLISKGMNCPESITLEFLSSRIWIIPENIAVAIDHVPLYEELSAEAARLADKGTSVNVIASVLGVTWERANQSLVFARTGKRPATKPPGRRTGKGDPRRKVIDVAEVVRLRDVLRMSFKKIARQLGVSTGTIARAYDRGNPDAVKNAAESGENPKRGHYTHLSTDIFEQIRARLKAGEPAAKIAKNLGCGLSTVYRVRRKIPNEAA